MQHNYVGRTWKIERLFGNIIMLHRTWKFGKNFSNANMLHRTWIFGKFFGNIIILHRTWKLKKLMLVLKAFCSSKFAWHQTIDCRIERWFWANPQMGTHLSLLFESYRNCFFVILRKRIYWRHLKRIVMEPSIPQNWDWMLPNSQIATNALKEMKGM